MSRQSKRKNLSTSAVADSGDELVCDEHFEEIDDALLTAAADRAAATAANKKSKKATIELAEEEEEKDAPPPQAVTTMVTAAAAAAPSSSSVAMKQDSTVVIPDFADDVFDENVDQEKVFMDKFYLAERTCKPLMRAGKLPFKNPDLQLYMMSKLNNWNVHALQYDPDSVAPEPILDEEGKDARIKSTLLHSLTLFQEDEKVWDPALKKRVKKADGAVYTNLRNIREARFPPIGPLSNSKVHILTPFCMAPFLKYGPTVELGSEGHRGKKIKLGIVADDAAQIQFSLSTQKFTHLQENTKNATNPVASRYINKVRPLIADKILEMACNQPSMLIELREKRKAKELKEAEQRSKDKREIQPYEKAGLERSLKQYILDEGWFKVCEGEGDGRGNGEVKRTAFAVSCFRTIYKDKATGQMNETAEDMVASSELYKLVTMKKGKPVVQFKLPVFRARSDKEVEDGVAYNSPFLRIPHDQVCLTPALIISVLYALGFYECQYDVCGLTQKEECIIVLGYKEEIELMDDCQVTPVDPRVAFPMASLYKGIPNQVEGQFETTANGSDVVNFVSAR